jgi:hypothetical protein
MYYKYIKHCSVKFLCWSYVENIYSSFFCQPSLPLSGNVINGWMIWDWNSHIGWIEVFAKFELEYNFFLYISPSNRQCRAPNNCTFVSSIFIVDQYWMSLWCKHRWLSSWLENERLICCPHRIWYTFCTYIVYTIPIVIGIINFWWPY